jgi:hypothetical protein
MTRLYFERIVWHEESFKGRNVPIVVFDLQSIHWTNLRFINYKSRFCEAAAINRQPNDTREGKYFHAKMY